MEESAVVKMANYRANKAAKEATTALRSQQVAEEKAAKAKSEPTGSRVNARGGINKPRGNLHRGSSYRGRHRGGFYGGGPQVSNQGDFGGFGGGFSGGFQEPSNQQLFGMILNILNSEEQQRQQQFGGQELAPRGGYLGRNFDRGAARVSR